MEGRFWHLSGRTVPHGLIPAGIGVAGGLLKADPPLRPRHSAPASGKRECTASVERAAAGLERSDVPDGLHDNPATNSSTSSARRPRLPPHDRRSLRLRRSDSTSGQSVASGVHSGGTLAFDPAESVDEGRPSSRPSSMPHRSRAGQRMSAVGAGARGSRCVHRARPASRCREIRGTRDREKLHAELVHLLAHLRRAHGTTASARRGREFALRGSRRR